MTLQRDRSMQYPATEPQFPRDFFLRAICAVYAVAFASIGDQIDGLYGKDGLEPVDVFLQKKKAQDHRLAQSPTLARLMMYPTAVWLHEELNWSPSFVMELIASIGMTVALLGIISQRWRTSLLLTTLWFFYLSIVLCGQTFMQFQWDSFLLEVGFLAIWIAPWWTSQSVPFETPAAAVWTLRFLFFKFMLMSGAVKIQSRCPTWLGLTALNYHFAKQPLPLPLSWYAHQLPPLLLSLGVAATLLFEGPWTFFILTPVHAVRKFSAAMQMLLQVMIMLTGNYNFFNILTCIMAFAMLDVHVPTSTQANAAPAVHQRIVNTINTRWHAMQQSAKTTVIAAAVCAVYGAYSITEAFAVGVEVRIGSDSMCTSASIRFTPTVEETQAWLARILPISIVAAGGIIVVAAMWQLVVCTVDNKYGPKSKALRLVHLMASTLVSCWIFTSSVLTLSILDRPFQHSLPPAVYQVYETTSHLRITSAYGLFRTMTGVGTVTVDDVPYPIVARPEIIVEGTDDHGATWKPYHFVYKPGDVNVGPKVNVPFQPRLDWQMWFAALGDYHSAPWFVHLVHKLLLGSPTAKSLLDASRDPFPHSPPQAIRAQLYYYDFTRLNTSWNRQIPTSFIISNTQDPQWWARSFHKDYLPALEQGNPSLEAFVKHHFGHQRTEHTQDPCTTNSSSWNCWWYQLLHEFVENARLYSVVIAVVFWTWEHLPSVAMFHFPTHSSKEKIE